MKNSLLLSCIILTNSFIYAQTPGYYNKTADKSGEELKTALHTIIDNHVDFSYSDAKYILNYADEDPDNPNNLIQLYTNRSASKDSWGTGDNETNREHVWAKSHGNFSGVRPMDGDAHNLHAADASTNVARLNYDFDEVTDGTYISEADAYYGGGAFEPADRDKGAIARTILYMAVRYEGTNNELDLEAVDTINTSPSPEHGKLSTLLEWNKNFPPTSMEVRRNERVFQSQLNRNPFIDNPKFADIIWNSAQVSGTTISNISMSPEHPKTTDTPTFSATFTNNEITPSAMLYWGKTFDSETYASAYTGSGAMTATIDLSNFTENELIYLKTVTSDGIVKHNTFYVAPNKTVTAISSIQGTGNTTPMENQEVTISGIVTANLDNSFYMQSGSEKRSGICVYSNWRGRIGDSVTVTGIAIDYQNLTELSDVSMVYSYGFKDTLNPTPLAISDLNEDYEGMFVQLDNVTFSAPDETIPAAGGTYLLTQGSTSINIYIRYNSRITGEYFPQGNLQVKAILSQYGGSYQLLIDNINWVSYIKETDAPIANSDYANTSKNTAVTIMPLENDVYNPGINFKIYENGQNGDAEIPFTNPNAISYTPNTDFVGIDTIRYIIEYSAQPDLNAIGDIIINIGGNSVIINNFTKINIYPNPSNGNFTLKFAKNETSAKSISIYDLSGKLVYSEHISRTKTEHQLKLNNVIKKGCYLLDIESQGIEQIQKIIIQ